MAHNDGFVSRVPGQRTFANSFASTGAGSARPLTTPFYEALVVDVILDHMHAQYADDGYNVGCIKVRLLSVQHGVDDDLLSWADPIDSTLQELPLIGELVLVQKVMGSFFYIRTVNIARRIQENAMIGLNESLNKRFDKLNKSKITNPFSQLAKEVGPNLFGEYFKPDSRVRPLKHFEGDVLVQGRMGHSIRFGSSKMDPSSDSLAPNIILRTGQSKNAENDMCSTDTPFGVTIEDINKDASSIWMTSDQATPFQPTTHNAASFMRSSQNHINLFDGAQIIQNSDRIVLNAKKTHIMMFSNEEVYINSFKNTSIDTDSSILLTANLDIHSASGRNIEFVSNSDFLVNSGKDVFISAASKTSLLGSKIYIGSVDEDGEPMVGGTSLSKWLARLILVLMGEPSTVLPWIPPVPPIVPPVPVPGSATVSHVVTAVGPGVLNPLIVTGLISLYTELVKPNLGQKIPTTLFAGAPFNSNDNFVKLANSIMPFQKNNFKTDGKQETTENNKWILSDTSYYKVT